MIKLMSLVKEVSTKTRINNLKYYTVLLQQSPLSYNTKSYVLKVINSINKQNGLATPNQYMVLQKLKNGEYTGK